MQLIIVAIYDRKLTAYVSIGPARAKGEALRNFEDAINNQQAGHLYQHPDDFELHQVGAFDDQTGRIEPLDKPDILHHGSEAKLSRNKGA